MFVSFEVSVQLVDALRPSVELIEQHDRNLGDQLRRAATSVVLNLAEGQRSAKGNKQKHYAIAHGSANEVKAALDVAEAWGWITHRGPERELVDRVLALLWKLTRSQAIAAPRNRARP